MKIRQCILMSLLFPKDQVPFMLTTPALYSGCSGQKTQQKSQELIRQELGLAYLRNSNSRRLKGVLKFIKAPDQKLICKPGAYTEDGKVSVQKHRKTKD